ncbi:Calcipressin [Dichotomocladium elegans]|nr:Calcipressin [Dichotomocladium elegans]
MTPIRSSYLGIRLYYGQHNPINPDPKLFQLQVPKSKKNFMISPPGSPFEGWKQIPESPPNTSVLASDLTQSFSDLPDDDVEDLENFRLESPVESDDEDLDMGDARRPLLMVVRCRGNNTSMTDSQQQQLPLITVQDWDGEQQHKTNNRRCKAPKIVPTSLPPVRT